MGLTYCFRSPLCSQCLSATAAAAVADTAAISAYINARYHISKDLGQKYYFHRGLRFQEKLKKQNKLNIWGTFTENAKSFADQDCIWYSDPSTNPPTVYNYTWRAAYEVACRYAKCFLDFGVKPGDCVGFYLQNSPDFVLAWMGLMAIGCYPAHINYNLVGGALVHCTKVAETTLLLIDEDFKDRVLENEEMKALGVKVHVLDREFRERLLRIEPDAPDEKYTRGADEKTKMAIRYTR